MAFGDRFRLWSANRQMQADTDWATSQMAAQGYGSGNGRATNGGWYFGKNLGLERYELAQALPGSAGKAAEILFGKNGGKGPAVTIQPAKDYTPLYVIVGAVLLVAVLKK